MAKLKLGAIAEDKPVKVTHELPASVHRDLVAYAGSPHTRDRTADHGSGQANCAHVVAVHGNGPDFCKGSPPASPFQRGEG
jgi:hypothetical protein